MPPSSSASGLPRSAAVVNEEIRGLWLRAGGVLSAAERRRYEALLVEWAAAMQVDIVKAA